MDNNQEKSSLPTSFYDRYFNDASWPVKHVGKGTIIQESGHVTSKIFYVKKGLLRSYTIDDNGNTHTYMFAPEGWVASDLESHIFSRKSDLFIEALEDSEIIVVKEFTSDGLEQLQESEKEEIIHVLYKRVAVL